MRGTSRHDVEVRLVDEVALELERAPRVVSLEWRFGRLNG
jgi:hypothetical protein